MKKKYNISIVGQSNTGKSTLINYLCDKYVTAESKKLQGEGIADQRIAIANGLKQSVEEVRGAMEEGVTGRDVMNMLFMTQHYDTIARLGDTGVNTIFVPYSPSSVGDLQTQIQSSLLAVDAQKKSNS